jgi:cell division protein FtsX
VTTSLASIFSGGGSAGADVIAIAIAVILFGIFYYLVDAVDQV